MSVCSSDAKDVSSALSCELALRSRFLSFAHLKNAVAAFSRANGFSYVKRSTHYTESHQVSWVVLICSKGYNPSKSKAASTPKEQLCPFKVTATLCPKTKNLIITAFVNKHNHPLVDLALRFATRNRRLTPMKRAEVLELKGANVKASEIVTLLKNRSGKYITDRQIYNALCSSAQKDVDGMSECSKLLAFVGSSTDLRGFYSTKEAACPEFDNPLRGVFVCFSQSVSRFCKAPQVLLIDGTFGTNRFNLPATLFVSKDEHDIMYCIGFSLTGTQTVDDYIWVLESFVLSVGESVASAIDTVFTDRELALFNAVGDVLPAAHRQLCQWHIRKDVASYASKHRDLNDEARKEYVKAFNALISCRVSCCL